jgi:hypothetical protein
MHQFLKFILEGNSTCFGQFLCPSLGVFSLHTQQWYVSYSTGAGSVSAFITTKIIPVNRMAIQLKGEVEGLTL